MTEYFVAARELGLLFLWLALIWWLGVNIPKAALWLSTTWLAEQEKNRQAHRELSEHQDARAEKFLAAVASMCKYHRVDE